MSSKSAPVILPDGREKVWILEMNSTPLKGEKKDKTFKFKGVCAEFSDEMNENMRMYDKGNYDEKASDLMDKIKKRALLGELDHNEDFLVSMKNVSHIVTGLHDKGKQYEIEVELVNTEQGKNAIALAEAGVPLFISSRASGYIDRAGNVTLEKIYTYDIVSEPGFKNAELIPVNESLAPSRTAGHSEIKIFRWTEPGNKDGAQKSTEKINKSNVRDMKYATKAELDALSQEFKLLKKNGLRAINESLQIPSKLKYNGISVEMLTKIPQSNDILTIDSVDYKVSAIENIDESKETSPNFKLRGTYAFTIGLEGAGGVMKTGYITKTGEFHIADEGVAPLAVKESFTMNATLMKVFGAMEAKINELVDSVNASKQEQVITKKYVDGLSRIVESTVNGHDKMVKFVNLLADHSDNSTGIINALIQNSDLHTKRLGLITESLEATQLLINETIPYLDTQANVLNSLIGNQDKATKHLNMLHQHADQMTNVLNVHESKINRGIKAPAAVNESRVAATRKQPVNEVGKKGGKESILDVTKNILAKVNSNKTEETRLVLEAKYPFTKTFTEAELKEFRALPDSKKTHVLSKLGPKARKANVMEAIRYAAKQVSGLEFLDHMSEEQKKEWAFVPTTRKQSIIALFQSKNLQSKASMEAFWDTINLKTPKTTGFVRRIDENIEHTVLEKGSMGYTPDDMNSALGL